jgi:hypothetical protein
MDLISSLECKEDFDKKLLNDYKEVLDRVFQIIYEIKVDTTWERIYRPSKSSNFVTIIGIALLPKGTTLSSTQVVEDDVSLNISFTFPWASLTDNSTPYQIAEIVRNMSILRNVLGVEEFFKLLKDPDTTMESLVKYFPKDYEDQPPEEPPINDKKTIVDDFSFDYGKLTEKQLQSYSLFSYKIILIGPNGV